MFAAGKTSGVLVPAGPDAQFNYVSMLLHGDGTNGAQNNTFLDSSTNAFTITRNGNTTQGSFSPYGANWSNNFNGSSSFSLNVSGVAAGTSTFTFEAWVFLTSLASDSVLFDTRSSNGASTTGMSVAAYATTGNIKFYDGTENNLGGTVTANVWTHIALVRNSSNVVTAYINGTATGTTVSSTRNFSDQYFWIASVPGPAAPYLNGYMSNLRWVVGTAVYTSNFTPSTIPLTAIANTKILTCQSNRFIDNSANAFAITVNGTPSVQRFNPFGASTAYSTAVIGGSAYFDGNGDTLSLASQAALNFSTGDFTLEAWVYATTTLGDATCILTAVTNGGLMFGTNGVPGSGVWAIGRRGVAWDYSSSTVPAVNQWQHVAVCRSGTSVRIFINGVQSGTTGTNSTAYDLGLGGTVIGYQVNYMNGYFSSVRATNTALYTTTFTPPSAPLTAVSGTALLLLTTNAAILDNAMMNDLETVGNAQISTSVYKYGTASMVFDGSTGKLVSPYSPWMDFKTGNFTIEMWIYFNVVLSSQTNNAGIVVYRSASLENTSLNLRCLTTNNIAIQLGGTSSSFAWTPSATTWYHLALSRSGSNLYMFVNGTQQGSTATNSGNVTFETGYVFTIGGNPAASVFFNGYIDDLRITKGYARYTTTFTPPTAAFSDTGPN